MRGPLAVLALAVACVLAVLSAWRGTASPPHDDPSPTLEDVGQTDVDLGRKGEVGSGRSGVGAGPWPDASAADNGSVADALSTFANERGSTVEEQRVSKALPGAAEDVLGRYRREGTCLVAYAGYLDLLGNAWGCVMEGPGWVDVCVVEEVRGSACVVRSVRMEPSEEELRDAM